MESPTSNSRRRTMASNPNKQQQQQQKESESRCSSGRRSSVSMNSPEFEFWNILKNPSTFPPPTLLSADQLFSDGFLLPLHPHLHDPPFTVPEPEHEPIPTAAITKTEEPEESASATTTTLTASKRWKLDLFKKPQQPINNNNKDTKEKKDKEKKRDKKTPKTGTGAGTGTGTQLNINIWPFSRSRSAGNGTTRPKISPATRKASSAPCSRSNSSGESKSSRKSWPSSPGRGGVHLGRSSPVWHVRRGSGLGSGSKSSEAAFRNGERFSKKEAGNSKNMNVGGSNYKAKVLSINVPTCIGYRHHLTCTSYADNTAINVRKSNDVVSGNSNVGVGSSSNSNLFSLRNLFTKKVH